jgi:hypothetical protein
MLTYPLVKYYKAAELLMILSGSPCNGFFFTAIANSMEELFCGMEFFEDYSHH